MPPIIDHKKCISCGYCTQICPLDVLKFDYINDQKQIIVRYPDECWHCRACEKDCPKQAIKMRYPLSHLLLYIEPDGGKENVSETNCNY